MRPMVRLLSPELLSFWMQETSDGTSCINSSETYSMTTAKSTRGSQIKKATERMAEILGTEFIPSSLPDSVEKRNEYPMADGLLDYFPNALAEVSRLSYLATQQHHPGEPMHWDRSKSTDHRNKIMRHLTDTGRLDDKGLRHSTMVAWRALALLQEELEKDEGYPAPRACRNV